MRRYVEKYFMCEEKTVSIILDRIYGLMHL